MGSIKVDTSKLDAFADKLKSQQANIQHQVMEKCINDLTARLLSKTIRQTPRDTSNLARGWVATPNVKKSGNTYSKTVYNPVEYAPYVEYGHRTRNHRGWVPGFFMLTSAVEDIDGVKDRIVSDVVNKYFKELFND